MRVGGGKPKGNSYELDICKQLSRWVSNNQRSDLFVRNVTSGAAFTVAAKKGQTSGIPGDIMASDGDPRSNSLLKNYLVECKHWKKLNLDLALWNPKEELYKQLFKTIEQSSAFDRGYLFIAKQNYKPALVFSSLLYRHVEFLTIQGSMYHELWQRRVCLCLLSDLFKIDSFHFTGIRNETSKRIQLKYAMKIMSKDKA